MAKDVQSEESKALNQVEHNTDASAKRVIIRAQDPATGNWVNISAVDNGDGTFGLSTKNGGTLVPEAFDYISAAYPDADTEVYTYKEGGSGGTTVATVTVNYTDSTKALIANVTRT